MVWNWEKIEMREKIKKKKKISFWKQENEESVKKRPDKSFAQTNEGV